jgi:hypothetical protein
MRKLATRKQLLKVAGQSLLGRIIGQVRRLELEPTVIGWPDLGDVVMRQYGCELVTLRYAGNCILDGLAGCEPRWCDGRNTFLLGDVVYSKAAIDTILGCTDEVQFFGTSDVGVNTGELFGYTCAGESVNLTAQLLMIAPCRRVVSEKGQGGHLRNLIWLWMRFHGMYPSLPREYNEALFTPIEDWTNDLDTDEQVETLLPELDRHARTERALFDAEN